MVKNQDMSLSTSIKILLSLALCLLFPLAGHAEIDILHHDLNVTLFPSEKRLLGHDTIDAYPDGVSALILHLSRKASVEELTVNGKKSLFTTMDGRIQVALGPENRVGRISIGVQYSVVFDDPIPENPVNADDPGYGVTGIISENGSFLLSGSGWYPGAPGSLSTYKLVVTAPADILAVSAGQCLGHRTHRGRTASTWSVEHPIEGLALSAGRYVVTEKKVGDIMAYTYFFPESGPLAKSYLEAASKYINSYEDLFGPYPYRKFAVVENFFSTGYSFPSYTLLGSRVLRLPFIIETSLGHEIAHSWWGNGVFVDHEKGNWCEGLATYVADHLFMERLSEEEARDYRGQILRGFATLVGGENDFPLNRFQSRYDSASQAIGYGKGAMVFHMLRRKVGEEAFWNALKDLYKEKVFQKTSWDDFRETFERHAKGPLKAFFAQWVSRHGAPRLALDHVSVQRDNGAWKLRGRIVQTAPYYDLDLIMEIRTASGEVKRKLSISEQSTPFEFILEERPDSVTLDPDVDLFRELYPSEIPPTINSLKASPSLLLVLSESLESGMGEVAKSLTLSLGVRRFEIRREGDLREEEMKEHDLIFLGVPGRRGLIPNLPEGLEIGRDGFTIDGKKYDRPTDAFFGVVANPREPGRYTALFLPSTLEGATEVARKITHYGKYSYLAFRKGKNTVKGTWPVQDSPLMWRWKGGTR